jgi:hypothetical protein
LCLVVIRSFSTPVGISSSKVDFHDLKYPWLRWQMWKRWNVVER